MNRKDELLERKAALEVELSAVNAELATISGSPTLIIEGEIGKFVEYLLNNETAHEAIERIAKFKDEWDKWNTALKNAPDGSLERRVAYDSRQNVEYRFIKAFLYPKA